MLRSQVCRSLGLPLGFLSPISLVNRVEFREKMKTDPTFFDAKIAGWWVWGISQWIGSGWCSRPEWSGRTNAGRTGRGIHNFDPNWQCRPFLTTEGQGVHSGKIEYGFETTADSRKDMIVAAQT